MYHYYLTSTLRLLFSGFLNRCYPPSTRERASNMHYHQY